MSRLPALNTFLGHGDSREGGGSALHHTSMGTQPSAEAAIPVLTFEEGPAPRKEAPRGPQAARPSDRPGPRTADEIKAAYGRPTKR
jgi:hypothetical protein